jgi:hypothetical protein
LRWPRDTLYPQKLAPTSPISVGRSVGKVRLRTKGHGVFFMDEQSELKDDSATRRLFLDVCKAGDRIILAVHKHLQEVTYKLIERKIKIISV